MTCHEAQRSWGEGWVRNKERAGKHERSYMQEGSQLPFVHVTLLRLTEGMGPNTEYIEYVVEYPKVLWRCVADSAAESAVR
jgi:hypothetical protein